MDKRENSTMKISGIHFTPLLVGKVQIGTIHNIKRDLLIKELRLWNIDVDPNENITGLKKVIEVEYAGKNVSAEDKKYFTPKLLTTSD